MKNLLIIVFLLIATITVAQKNRLIVTAKQMYVHNSSEGFSPTNQKTTFIFKSDKIIKYDGYRQIIIPIKEDFNIKRVPKIGTYTIYIDTFDNLENIKQICIEFYDQKIVGISTDDKDNLLIFDHITYE